MMRLYCLVELPAKALSNAGKQLHRTAPGNAIISSLNKLIPIKIVFAKAPGASLIHLQKMY